MGLFELWSGSCHNRPYAHIPEALDLYCCLVSAIWLGQPDCGWQQAGTRSCTHTHIHTHMHTLTHTSNIPTYAPAQSLAQRSITRAAWSSIDPMLRGASAGDDAHSLHSSITFPGTRYAALACPPAPPSSPMLLNTACCGAAVLVLLLVFPLEPWRSGIRAACADVHALVEAGVHALVGNGWLEPAGLAGGPGLERLCGCAGKLSRCMNVPAGQ